MKRIFLYMFITILIAYLAQSVTTRTSFEELMKDLPKCQVADAYIDVDKNEPKHPYFRENKLSPYKIENGFAYYRVNTTYLELPVAEIMIPASTWGILSVTFNVPLETSRARLKKILGSEFKLSKDAEDGVGPYLIANPEDKKQSIFFCDNST